MVFSSTVFLFFFLPAVLAFYFLTPKKYRLARNMVLLMFSMFFYLFGEPKGIFVMLISIGVNYFAARFIGNEGKKSGLNRAILIGSIVANLGLLGYYKYTGFLLGNISNLFGLTMEIPSIIMPIGISFFTFQGMSYVFDVYGGKVPAQTNILNVAMYISLFPQLVAGPIVRYETIAEAIGERSESMEQVADGLLRFIIGLSKKVLIANPMGKIATDIFAMEPNSMAPSLAWMGILAFSFQILYDFSGYSDMAIGLGKVFGFQFPENFNYPYTAQSITDFWRRWHMSLSQWFRDYVYIPLGGNKKGLKRQTLNILIVWSLTGFWHGAAWNFIVWGLYFAVILALEKWFLGKVLKSIPRVFRHLYSLFFIVISWVIFNSPNMAYGARYIRAMFSPESNGTQWNYIVYLLQEYRVEFIFAFLLTMPVAGWISKRFAHRGAFSALCYIGAFLLLILSALSVVNTSFNPFIYFRF